MLNKGNNYFDSAKPRAEDELYSSSGVVSLYALLSFNALKFVTMHSSEAKFQGMLELA